MGFVVLTLILLGASADIQVYFSPGDTCEKVIIQAIEEADSTIDAALYFFTDSDIAYALTRAHYRGVSIRVLYDDEGAESDFSKAKFLATEGIAVRYDPPETKMHHKFAVIDDSVVLTGSYNWTASAATLNNENLVVISSRAIAAMYAAEFASLWLAARDYVPSDSEELAPAIAPRAPPTSTVPSVPKDYTVYITRTGSKYHRLGCRYLHSSCIPISKSEAIRRGYTPCSVCNP